MAATVDLNTTGPLAGFNRRWWHISDDAKNLRFTINILIYGPAPKIVRRSSETQGEY